MIVPRRTRCSAFGVVVPGGAPDKPDVIDGLVIGRPGSLAVERHRFCDGTGANALDRPIKAVDGDGLDQPGVPLGGDVIEDLLEEIGV